VVPEERLPIAGEDDIVAVRERARAVARAIGFGALDQTRVATAVSELARNVVRYATGGRGEAVVRVLPPAGGRVGIEVVVRDEGPGIDDLARALRPGFTSGHGLGLGLPGARRLMDEFEIETGPGRGTTVTVRTRRPWRTDAR
jgi:serine/threonine-protein kinase RsbT